MHILFVDRIIIKTYKVLGEFLEVCVCVCVCVGGGGGGGGVFENAMCRYEDVPVPMMYLYESCSFWLTVT